MNRFNPVRKFLLAFAAVVALCPALTLAHAFEITDTRVLFKTDGTYEIEITYHLDAMLAEITTGDPTEEEYERLRSMPPDELEKRIKMAERFFQVMTNPKFDGEGVEGVITFPEMEEARDREPSAVALPGQTVRISGQVPEGATEFVWSCSPVFRMINLVIKREWSDVIFQELLPNGWDGTPYPLTAPPVPPTRLEVSGRYVRLGFGHIVPEGLDHILFVLGLFLLSVKLGPLLWQVTAFTLAHTITLALGVLGIVSIPASIVEPLIALSIAYVAIENIFTSKLKPWRPAVVFAFGLLHGLGFASVLLNLGFPRAQFVTALVTFNVGVELGQLTVIALAFLATIWFRRQVWYRGRIIIPASCAIALVALYWTIERMAASFA